MIRCRGRSPEAKRSRRVGCLRLRTTRRGLVLAQPADPVGDVGADARHLGGLASPPWVACPSSPRTQTTATPSSCSGSSSPGGADHLTGKRGSPTRWLRHPNTLRARTPVGNSSRLVPHSPPARWVSNSSRSAGCRNHERRTPAHGTAVLHGEPSSGPADFVDDMPRAARRSRPRWPPWHGRSLRSSRPQTEGQAGPSTATPATRPTSVHPLPRIPR
jgi:hypothetical protein